MPSRIAASGIDATRPEVVTEFWCEVLDWRVIDVDGDLVSIAPTMRRVPR